MLFWWYFYFFSGVYYISLFSPCLTNIILVVSVHFCNCYPCLLSLWWLKSWQNPIQNNPLELFLMGTSRSSVLLPHFCFFITLDEIHIKEIKGISLPVLKLNEIFPSGPLTMLLWVDTMPPMNIEFFISNASALSFLCVERCCLPFCWLFTSH